MQRLGRAVYLRFASQRDPAACGGSAQQHAAALRQSPSCTPGCLLGGKRQPMCSCKDGSLAAHTPLYPLAPLRQYNGVKNCEQHYWVLLNASCPAPAVEAASGSSGDEPWTPAARLLVATFTHVLEPYFCGFPKTRLVEQGWRLAGVSACLHPLPDCVHRKTCGLHAATPHSPSPPAADGVGAFLFQWQCTRRPWLQGPARPLSTACRGCQPGTLGTRLRRHATACPRPAECHSGCGTGAAVCRRQHHHPRLCQRGAAGAEGGVCAGVLLLRPVA